LDAYQVVVMDDTLTDEEIKERGIRIRGALGLELLEILGAQQTMLKYKSFCLRVIKRTMHKNAPHRRKSVRTIVRA
jgi:hypothetical protein